MIGSGGGGLFLRHIRLLQLQQNHQFGHSWKSCFQTEDKRLGTLGGFFDFSQPTESMTQGMKSFGFMIRWTCTSALSLPSCVTLLKLLTLSESVSSSVEWEGGSAVKGKLDSS